VRSNEKLKTRFRAYTFYTKRTPIGGMVFLLKILRRVKKIKISNKQIHLLHILYNWQTNTCACADARRRSLASDSFRNYLFPI